MKKRSKNLLFPILVMTILHRAAIGNYKGLNHTPLDGFYPYEEETNDTIDEMIMHGMQSLKGVTRNDSGILTELDMFLTQEQFYELYQTSHSHNGRRRRKAMRSVARRWPGGIVPYKMTQGHFSKKDEYMIQRAMTEIERYTCVTFRPVINTDSNFIQFQDGESCSSHLGMVSRGRQVVNLSQRFCRYKGLYLHEIGHALGLVHEHQLPNRDKYIEIIKENVKPEYLHNFYKYSDRLVDLLGLPYDVTSVMHYGVRSFSKNGKRTIRVRHKTKDDIVGRVYRKELAYTDVYAINLMYNCSGHCPNKTKCGPNGHVDKNCNCLCRDGSQDCDTTRQVPKSECRNRNRNSWKCFMWANQGNCVLNNLIMRRRCAKACGLCEPKAASDRCEDVENRCAAWKERGDCVTNPDWMRRNCQMTCNFCKTNGNHVLSDPSSCGNSLFDSDICDRLALMGQCLINADWMSTNCASSCRACPVGTEPPDTLLDQFSKGDTYNGTIVPVGNDEMGRSTSVLVGNKTVPVDSVDLENSTSIPVGSIDLENSTSTPVGSDDSENSMSSHVGNVDHENSTSIPVGSDDSENSTSSPVGSVDLENRTSISVGNVDHENSTSIPVGSDDFESNASSPVGSVDLDNSTSVPISSDDYGNSTSVPDGSEDFDNSTLPQ